MGALSRHSRSARGNALLLSVLILLALTAVGIMAVQRTNTELMVSGNVARSMQAGLASEAGLFHALGLAGAEPNNYVLAATGQRTAFLSTRVTNLGSLEAATCNPPSANQRLAVDVACRSSALPAADPNQFLPVVQPNPAQELARLNQDLAYDSELIPLGTTTAPGYQHDAKICFRIFDFNARGGIPTRREPIASTLCPRNDPACVAETVVIETRARALAGPTQCQ